MRTVGTLHRLGGSPWPKERPRRLYLNDLGRWLAGFQTPAEDARTVHQRRKDAKLYYDIDSKTFGADGLTSDELRHAGAAICAAADEAGEQEEPIR